MENTRIKSRIGYLTHKGKQVMHIDHSAVAGMPDIEATRAFFARARKEIDAKPGGSVRLLTSMSPKMQFNTEIVALEREFVKENTPYMKKSAVVGIRPIMKAILATFHFITGREIRIFDTTEEALDWLVE